MVFLNRAVLIRTATLKFYFSFLRDLFREVPPISSICTNSKQSSVKCSLHTYTFFGSSNLFSRHNWSSHFFAKLSCLTGTLWKDTPVSLSLLDLLLQSGAAHDGIFSPQQKEKQTNKIYGGKIHLCHCVWNSPRLQFAPVPLDGMTSRRSGRATKCHSKWRCSIWILEENFVCIGCCSEAPTTVSNSIQC